ncbi:MAG: hypothetical protein KF802_03145 [Bdellovibrionaceae bacterium]|nr:hypothetical protein [Pseudobdellovibrionaceae bacterium]
MKFLALSLLMFSLNVPAETRLGEPLQILFTSPAVQEVCADVVTPHPTKPGFWHLERPNFALSETTLFATRHLRPTAAGAFAITAIDRANPVSAREVIRFQERPADIQFHGGKLWVLFRNRLLSVDPQDGQVLSEARTHDPSFAPETHAAAHSMTWVGDRLIIAHGSRGLALYDERANHVQPLSDLGLQDQGGHISKAIDVTPINERQVLVVVDNVTVSEKPPFAFNGLMIVDVQSRSVTKFPSNRAQAGGLSYARAKVVGDKVVINNWGLLQVAKLSDMKQSRTMQGSWLVTRTQQDNLFVELMGDFYVENDQVLVCAQAYGKDATTGRPSRQGIFYSRGLE